MNKESKIIAKKTWDAKQVGDLLLNNALFILMAIAIIYIAISNPRFIQPASIINIISQTAAYLPAALGIAGTIVLTGTDLSDEVFERASKADAILLGAMGWPGIRHADGQPLVIGLQCCAAACREAAFLAGIMVVGAVFPGIVGDFVVIPDADEGQFGMDGLQVAVAAVLRITGTVIAKAQKLIGG